VHPAFSQTDHRPFPHPDTRWTWRQSWRDLLFMHWPVPVDTLRPLVPDGLTIQEYEGTSWVGLVPFRMTGVMRRELPDLPGLSAFPELNVRLYVEHNGVPGVWFVSLDATNPLAVWAAKRLFHLPYFTARISLTRDADWYVYHCQRLRAEQEFMGRYRPIGPVTPAQPGTLDHWLTERYCLFAQSRRGAIFRADVHHVPWPLQPAECQVEINTMAASQGIPLPDVPPLLHFAERIDVVVWDPQRTAI
jgi:uncharacterized protein YqjF (DUF2071 family)